MVKLLHFLVFHFSPQKDRGKLLSGIHTKCFLSILIFYRSKQLKLSTPLLSSPLFSTIFARSKWTRVFGFSIRNPKPMLSTDQTWFWRKKKIFGYLLWKSIVPFNANWTWSNKYLLLRSKFHVEWLPRESFPILPLNKWWPLIFLINYCLES